MLDAEERIGEILKEIPEDGRGRPLKNSCNSATNKKSKEQVIRELDFEKTQASRFETLADNQDIIEQVKAEKSKS